MSVLRADRGRHRLALGRYNRRAHHAGRDVVGEQVVVRRGVCARRRSSWARLRATATGVDRVSDDRLRPDDTVNLHCRQRRPRPWSAKSRAARHQPAPFRAGPRPANCRTTTRPTRPRDRGHPARETAGIIVCPLPATAPSRRAHHVRLLMPERHVSDTRITRLPHS